VVVPSFSYLRVSENDSRGRVRQGRRRQGAREREFFIPTESVHITFYNLGRPGGANQKLSREKLL